MVKKHTILFIASVFFLGTLGTGLCLTLSSKVTLNCCPSKSSSSQNTEDCFSHCAKQKLNAIKIETNLEGDSKIKTHILLDNKSSGSPQSQLLSSSHFTKYYLIQIAAKLNIGQIYFLAIFNHAPPLYFN